MALATVTSFLKRNHMTDREFEKSRSGSTQSLDGPRVTQLTDFQDESLSVLCNRRFFFRLDPSQPYHAISVNKDKRLFGAFGGQCRYM